MSEHTRRTFLTVSGAVLGGIAVGTQVSAAARSDRYIVDTASSSLDGLDVVHDLDAVDLAVVEATKGEMQSVDATYVADVEYTLQKPESGTLDTSYESTQSDDSPGKGKKVGQQDSSVTDEDLYPLQWDKQDLDVSTAHETTTGKGTRVAVIDSGVYADHPDLDVNLDLSKNFTDDGEGVGVPAGGDHGTHVGGIVAAQDNGTGVIGTAPDTDLVDCRVFSYGPSASFGDILAAVTHSVAVDADVANLSLGAYPIPREGLGGFYGKTLNRVMTYANANDTLLVIAAGNDSADLQHDGNFISLPNEGAQAVSVSATGPIGFAWGDDGYESPPESPAFYTNYGTNAVDLGAPGGDADLAAIGTGVAWYNDLVLNTTADVEFAYEDVDDDGEEEPVDYLDATPTYGWKAGTSMAAPNVAGAAALVKSANPEYGAGQVESALERAASVPSGYEKTYYGAGYLNILDAL